MVLHHSCSAPDRGREAQGRWFPPGPKFVLTFRVNPISRVKLSPSPGRPRLYSQPNCRLYCTFYCCRYDCYSFRFSFHSLVLLHHFRSPTHTSCTTLFLKGATPLLQQWQLQRCRRPIILKNLNPLLFYWSRQCGSILDFQWLMLTTFALLTKKPQFASSAETRWKVILFKFPIDWRYKLLLHYVVNKCFKFDNVVWYIANKGQILYCIKV